MKTGCVIFFLFYACTTFSQSNGLTLSKLFPIKAGAFLLFEAKKEMMRKPMYYNVPAPQATPFKNPYRYQDDLGFFCKVELKWDKKLMHPFRFRLGSYDYVNRLEGK